MVSRRKGDLKGKGDEVPCPKEMGDPRSTYLGKYFLSTYCVSCLGKGRKYESFYFFFRLRDRAPHLRIANNRRWNSSIGGISEKP